MFRGHSVSGDDPAVTAGISYEADSGIYAGASTSAVAGEHEGPRFNSAIQYIGFARRTGRVTLDIGVVHRSYSHDTKIEYAADTFEGYVGVTGRNLGARLSVSPDYGGRGQLAAYFEANATIMSRSKWSLSGHLGALLPPREHGAAAHGTVEPDWRFVLSRQVGRVSLGLGWAGLRHKPDRTRTSQRLFVSLSSAF